MGKFILGLLLGLVLGLAGGAFLLFGGVAGMAAATGLMTGACATVQAAQDEGLLTPDQVTQVFDRARENLREFEDEGDDPDEPALGGADECAALMARLRDVSEDD